MFDFKSWPWQKWVMFIAKAVIAIGAAVWQLLEGTPGWWPTIVAGLTLLIEELGRLFPTAIEARMKRGPPR